MKIGFWHSIKHYENGFSPDYVREYADGSSLQRICFLSELMCSTQGPEWVYMEI